MKLPTALEAADDSEEATMLGPLHVPFEGYHVMTRNRPSMISGKYRLKEERRKIIRLCGNKLKSIDDPESNLWRSVLINNTLKRLQDEAREEKLQKQYANYPPRYYSNLDNVSYNINLKSEFIKNEQLKHSLTSSEEECCEEIVNHHSETPQSKIEDVPTGESKNNVNVEKFDENKTEQNSSEITSSNMELLLGLGLVEDRSSGYGCFSIDNESNSMRAIAKKRFYEETESCDVQDVLSQFFMPPTPCMLTCFEDEDIVDTTIEGISPKRKKIEHQSSDASPNIDIGTTNLQRTSDSTNNDEVFVSNDTRQLDLGHNVENDGSSFGCGKASILGELRNSVFHNLFASLET